jgi:ubiquinone/menaquinone biosynthesis C-methylase UbiE
MTNLLQDKNYIKDQYCNGSNLSDRIQLHERFSTNKYGWMPWVFDQYEFSTDSRILEVGCGTGLLWQENIQRIPKCWNFILSDFSEGMVKKSRTIFNQSDLPFLFLNNDVQAIPFPGEEFDAVIANHMLYHVPDRPKALAEIIRVLKPSGVLYATSAGDKHLFEMYELLHQFTDDLPFFSDDFKNPFSLDNGLEQLTPYFEQVSVHHYDDAFEVTEVPPLLDYLLSGRAKMISHLRDELEVFLENVMTENKGMIRIQKFSGIFIARNPKKH